MFLIWSFKFLLSGANKLNSFGASIFLIWSFEFLLSGTNKFYLGLRFFLSGALNFSYLELRSLQIWSKEFYLSGALNVSFLEL